MRQIFTLCIILIYTLLAEDSFEKAQELELQGNYKEAMLIYKQLASKKPNSSLLLEKSLEKKEKPLFTNIKSDTNNANHNKEALTQIIDSFEVIEDKQTNQTIEQILSSSFDLYPYKENYLLPISYDMKKRDDRDQTEAVFQISVKKPIAYNLLGLKESLYFGYTQKSFWQIYAHSSPFRETNYKPEFYALIPSNNFFIKSLKAYKIGYLHESNGLSSGSRSWNRIYLEGYFQTKNLFFAPRVWLRIPEPRVEDDNPDIDQYLGYADLHIFYAHKDHTFKLLLRNNLKPNSKNRGFASLNWTFPFFGSKNNFGFIQLSSGYGESLIDYDKEINRIGFGISLSR